MTDPGPRHSCLLTKRFAALNDKMSVSSVSPRPLLFLCLGPSIPVLSRDRSPLLRAAGTLHNSLRLPYCTEQRGWRTLGSPSNISGLWVPKEPGHKTLAYPPVIHTDFKYYLQLAICKCPWLVLTVAWNSSCVVVTEAEGATEGPTHRAAEPGQRTGKELPF